MPEKVELDYMNMSMEERLWRIEKDKMEVNKSYRKELTGKLFAEVLAQQALLYDVREKNIKIMSLVGLLEVF